MVFTVLFSRSVQTPVHILNPGECMFYTWDKPLERKVLRWGLSGATVKEAKPIRVNKVRRGFPVVTTEDLHKGLWPSMR